MDGSPTMNLSPLDLVSALLTVQTDKLNYSAAQILSQNRQLLMILTTSVAVLIGCVVCPHLAEIFFR
ncbi:unnamed protein product [Rhodiola kirilowii]